MKYIVYESNSGFTKKYAELLSSKTGVAVCSLTEAKKQLSPGTDILFMGWIMAGSIKGFKKALSRYSVKAVCGVGMASPEEKMENEIKKRHSLTTIPLFYLQGGFDINRLTGMYKLMMKTMSKTAGAALEKKENRTPEEEKMLGMMKNGDDCVSEENLSAVLSWVGENK